MTDTPWHGLEGFEAVAPLTGPFGHAAFLSAVERHTGEGDLLLAGDGEGATMLSVGPGGIRLAGPEHLTDYHTPLGSGSADVLAATLEPMHGMPYRFDSLPVEAAAVIDSALSTLGACPEPAIHESTAVLELPASYDEWLMSIGKKERHEVRRKRRRFETEFGEIEVVRSGPEAIDTFCVMHRGSGGAKGSFMTPGMQAFFLDLLETADATIHSLTCNGEVRASAFGFETEAGYYFYNSAYDAEAAAASPGVVLFSAMIEQEIQRGATVFDFLKGDEPYKYRHGATARPLYLFEGEIP